VIIKFKSNSTSPSLRLLRPHFLLWELRARLTSTLTSCQLLGGIGWASKLRLLRPHFQCFQFRQQFGPWKGFGCKKRCENHAQKCLKVLSFGAFQKNSEWNSALRNTVVIREIVILVDKIIQLNSEFIDIFFMKCKINSSKQ